MARPPSAEVVLRRRQLYMLPTGYGLVFALVLMVLLLVAINYGNALVYALTFWLAAIGIVSMLSTHRNLLGLRLSEGPCSPVFAGDNASFQLRLNNSHGPRRLGVSIEQAKRQVSCVDLRAGEQTCIWLERGSDRRGYLAPPPVVLSTRFPLGLLYAWSRRVALQQRCLVYPRPASSAPLPVTAEARGVPDRGLHPEGEDFLGLREFRRGDSPRHVSWKAMARGRGMLIKQFGGGYRASVWLEWEALTGMATEERLGQLCRWVLDCERAGLQYGLRVPNKTLAPANGEEHRHRCLAALALFPG